MGRIGEVRFWLPIGTYVIDYYFGTLSFSNQKYHSGVTIDRLTEGELYKWEQYLAQYGRPSYGGGRGGDQQYTSVRLTGLFATKKPGLLVGTIEGEALDQLVEKIKEAIGKKKGITLFFKEVENGKGKLVAQIFADVDTREPRGAQPGPRETYRKPIQADPDAEDSGRSYDPFRNR